MAATGQFPEGARMLRYLTANTRDTLDYLRASTDANAEANWEYVQGHEEIAKHLTSRLADLN
jgi:hypothetical protein